MKFEEIWKIQNLKSTKVSNYFEVYEELLSKYKDKKITFVEIGLDNGASILSWKKYFSSSSRIIGIDIRKELKSLEANGVEIFIGDTRDQLFWNNFYKKVGNIDIILDDGGHDNKSQIVTMSEAIKNINDGGIIIVEDTDSSFKKEYGNPNKYSFINYTKKIIENVNYQSPYFNKIKIKSNFEKFRNQVYKISYYSSIVALFVDRKKCININIVTNNGDKNLNIDKNINDLNFFMKFIFKNKFIYNNLRKLRIKITNFGLKKFF